MADTLVVYKIEMFTYTEAAPVDYDEFCKYAAVYAFFDCLTSDLGCDVSVVLGPMTLYFGYHSGISIY